MASSMINSHIEQDEKTPLFLCEDDYFSIMEKYFVEKGPVYHQFESYEYMINYLIQKIVDETPSINIENKTIKYKSTLGQVYVENASFIDETHKVKHITPQEARLRDLTYESPIFLDINEEFWEFDEKASEFKKTDEIFHKKIFLMKIPTMVRSSKCNLYGLSMNECIEKGECSNDTGGYFIVNGKERVLVCQERLNYNQVYVFDANDEKIPFVAEIRSMSEETGHSVLIQAKMNKEHKNITFSLPYMSKEVLAGAVFKCLGFNSKDIIKFINPSSKEENIIVDRIVRESIQYKNKKEAMKHISKASMHKVEDDEERRLVYTQQVIENELFPHMGISSPLEKALFLGDMLNKLIRVNLRIRPQDDRDNVSLKRIEGPGVLVSDLFRMCMKRYCDNLKKYLEKRQDIITAMTRTNNITSSLKHAFSTGNWTVQKNGYVRTGVSQIMSRLTYPATISHLRRVIIPVGKEGKNVKIRQIHPTQCFFIDIIESPEGKSIGIVKNLALLCNITTGCNPILVRDLVEKCDNFEPINDSFFEDSNYEMYKIYINGAMFGFTDDPHEFYEELLSYRKNCMFSNQVSFYYDDEDREVRILCDNGRFIRPVLTVSNNKLNLKKEHLNMSWVELLENDIVRYIDSNEVEFSLIAMKPEDLITYSQSNYDYCEIHPSAMLGVCSAVIPYPEHNQSPRLVYQSSMVKQALGVYSLAFKERFDTISHIMHYPQKPIISTKFQEMLNYDEMLTGCNPIVAILTYGGWNQEDSIMLNKSSVDRGMFVHTCYKTMHCEEKKKTNCTFEKIEIPPAKSHNNTMNYSKLSENGVIKKGTPVVKGDIIIGKTLTKVKTDEDDDKTDCSLAIGNGEEGIIDDIWEGINDEGNRMVKVRIRQLRIPEVGDKLASRSSQKGVCGLLLSQEDMPFTSQGITPDVLINPNCIPSRMTLSQLTESLFGKVCSLKGEMGDATPFTSSSVDPAKKIMVDLQKLGFERHGNEKMYCGYTGEILEAEVFIGPTYYQRLKHLVKDKMHCLTLDHQVLTRNGWKDISNITIEDKVATLNKKGELYYQCPTNVWKYENYDGMIYHIKNQSIDLSVTGNHRMWVSKREGPRGNVKWSDYDFEKAEDIVGKHRRYKKDANWSTTDIQFTLPSVKSFLSRTFTFEEMQSFLVFFGVWYAEGWASGKKTCGRIAISVNKQRVKDALFVALDKLNYEYIYDKKDEKLYVSNNQLYNYMKPLSVGAPNKKLPEWVFDLSINQTRVLIESMVLGDGFYKNSKMVAYYTSSKEIADQFQQLCLHAGWSCLLSVHLKAGQKVQIHGRDVSNEYDILRLSIITTRSQPSVNHSHCNDQKIQEEKFVQEVCDVMCITVPNEVFYVRRNGKAVWTGNSRSKGNVTMMHHQPSEGRSRDGGLRTGVFISLVIVQISTLC